MAKHKKQSEGIVCICECYEDDPSIVWLCDTSKLDPSLHADLLHAIGEAIKADNDAAPMPYAAGFQGDASSIAAVEPPCMVTAVVTLYTD